MRNCNHRVKFKVDIENNSTPAGILVTCDLRARCPICNHDLNNENIKTALQRVYSPEVAEIIFNMYEHKKGFFELFTKLASLGVESPITRR